MTFVGEVEKLTLFQIQPKLKMSYKEQEIKLSSNWTSAGLYVGSILLLLISPVIIFAAKKQEFYMGMMIAVLIFLNLIGFLVYQFTHVCDARIIDDKIVLKKLFRPEKTYSFDKIGCSYSYQLKRTKYIAVEMKNEDNTVEKYLIINSKSLLSFENKDTEQVLISLRNKSKNK